MTTYLVKKNGELVSVSCEEWKRIISDNAKKPQNKRRYFIVDAIEFDRLIIEVSAKRYREWNKARMSLVRGGYLDEDIRVLSLDEPIDDAEEITLYDMVPDNSGLGEDAHYEEISHDLKLALKEWKPWGPTMLQLYLKGCKNEINELFAQKYGVSTRRARTCRHEFEKFVREYISNRS